MEMGGKNNKVWLVLPLLLLLCETCMQRCVDGEPQVPCLFIFGDSLSDSGNNNDLATLAKVNYKPYGIDFPTGPTGRFTNGLTQADIISTQLLGMEKLIPPFANTSGSDILKGVNYASGAAGIRAETGKQAGDNINMGLQIRNHRVTVSEIGRRLGGVEQGQQYLNKCLYHVNIGINDYINNYFMPQFYPSSRIYNPNHFAEVLIRQYSLQIRDLEGVGARKFALVGLGLIGCTPYAIATNGSSSCVEEQNTAASIFNDKLKSLVDQFNNNKEFSPDAKFVFVNTTAISTQNPQLFGFKVENASCCQTRASTALCVEDETPCENREEYVFWDGVHPTQAFNQILAVSSYNASDPAFTFPTDIAQLAHT